MTKKYKYITIYQKGSESWNDHPYYRIKNNKSGTELGSILYYPPFKDFIFNQTLQDAVWSAGCLADIMDFMQNEIPKAK